MTWARLDGGFPQHRKIAKVGLVGGWIYIEGLCHAAAQRTDGFIPAEILPVLLSKLGPVSVSEDSRAQGKLRRSVPAQTVDWPSRLVAAGLWEPCEGGWQIHNFLQRQPTRQYLEDLTFARREAGRKGGRTTQAKRQAFAQADAPMSPSSNQANGKHVT